MVVGGRLPAPAPPAAAADGPCPLPAAPGGTGDLSGGRAAVDTEAPGLVLLPAMRGGCEVVRLGPLRPLGAPAALAAAEAVPLRRLAELAAPAKGLPRLMALRSCGSDALLVALAGPAPLRSAARILLKIFTFSRAILSSSRRRCSRALGNAAGRDKVGDEAECSGARAPPGDATAETTCPGLRWMDCKRERIRALSRSSASAFSRASNIFLRAMAPSTLSCGGPASTFGLMSSKRAASRSFSRTCLTSAIHGLGGGRGAIREAAPPIAPLDAPITAIGGGIDMISVG